MIWRSFLTAIQRGRWKETSGGALAIGGRGGWIAERGRFRKRRGVELRGRLQARGLERFACGRVGAFKEDAPGEAAADGIGRGGDRLLRTGVC